MKVKLFFLEVSALEYTNLGLDNQWSLQEKLGSAPRNAGDVVEGMTVPEGKVWLFPGGAGFSAIEKFITGERIIKSVTI